MTDMPQGKLVECKYCDATGKVREPDHLGPLAIGTKKRPCPGVRWIRVSESVKITGDENERIRSV